MHQIFKTFSRFKRLFAAHQWKLDKKLAPDMWKKCTSIFLDALILSDERKKVHRVERLNSPGCCLRAGCLWAPWRWCRVSRWWRRLRYNLQQYFSSRALNSTHDHQINRSVHLGQQHRSKLITSARNLRCSGIKAEGIKLANALTIKLLLFLLLSRRTKSTCKNKLCSFEFGHSSSGCKQIKPVSRQRQIDKMLAYGELSTSHCV